MAKQNTIQDDHLKALANKASYRSNPLMTKYEFNQVVSLRTLHLSRGALPLIEIPATIIIDTNMRLRSIAERELVLNRLPYIVKRQMPNGKCEYWPVAELDLSAVRNLFRYEIGGQLHSPTMTTV